MPQSLLLKQFPLCHFKFMQSIFYVMKSKSKCWCEKEEEMRCRLNYGHNTDGMTEQVTLGISRFTLQYSSQEARNMDAVLDQLFHAVVHRLSNCLMTKYWRQKITMIQFPPCAEICLEYELMFPMPPVPKIIFWRDAVFEYQCSISSRRNMEMESSLGGWDVKESTFSDLRMEGATSQQHHKPLFPNLFPFPIHAHLILMFTQPKTTSLICYSTTFI